MRNRIYKNSCTLESFAVHTANPVNSTGQPATRRWHLFFGCLITPPKSALEMTHPEVPLMHRFAELNSLRFYRNPGLNSDFSFILPRTFQSVQDQLDVNLELPCSDPVRRAVFKKIIRRVSNTGLTLHPLTFHIGSLYVTSRSPCTMDVPIGHAGIFGRRVVSTDEMARGLHKPA